MRFGQALEEIVTWDGDGNDIGMRLPRWAEEVVIRVQVPDARSKMTAPYLYVDSRFGRVPWIPTMIEIMVENTWEIVK